LRVNLNPPIEAVTFSVRISEAPRPLCREWRDITRSRSDEKNEVRAPAVVLILSSLCSITSTKRSPHEYKSVLSGFTVTSKLIAFEDHEILISESIVYDALYAECKRRTTATNSRYPK
jgi:hypothetical protein